MKRHYKGIFKNYSFGKIAKKNHSLNLQCVHIWSCQQEKLPSCGVGVKASAFTAKPKETELMCSLQWKYGKKNDSYISLWEVWLPAKEAFVLYYQQCKPQSLAQSGIDFLYYWRVTWTFFGKHCSCIFTQFFIWIKSFPGNFT